MSDGDCLHLFSIVYGGELFSTYRCMGCGLELRSRTVFGGELKSERGDRVARCYCGHVQLEEAEGVTKIQHCKVCRVTITVKVRNGRAIYGNRLT